MSRRVASVTDAFLQASAGDEKIAAQVMSNFQSQRAVTPFVFHEIKNPVEKFGSNVADTIASIKSTTNGSYATGFNTARHCLIASGASGPLSKNDVRVCHVS